MDLTPFEAAVARVLAGLRPGDVVTYGEVAAEAGHPGAARAVGRYLARHGAGAPWWRVVASGGRLAPGKEADQARRLRAEGVDVDDVGGRVRHLGADRFGAWPSTTTRSTASTAAASTSTSTRTRRSSS